MNDAPQAESTPEPHVTHAEFEAGLMRQEHRPHVIVANFWKRKSYGATDPRASAATYAFFYWWFSFLIPTSAPSAGLIAVSSVIVAVWGTMLLMEQSRFEQDQRAVEMTLSLAGQWDANFNAETRRMLGRFVRVSNSIKDAVAREQFLTILAAWDSEADPTTIRNNPHLLELIGAETEGTDAGDAILLKALSHYQAALINACNTMESVAIIRLYSKSQSARSIIDGSYKGVIKQRTHELTPFIELVQRKHPEAWLALMELTYKKDWK